MRHRSINHSDIGASSPGARPARVRAETHAKEENGRCASERDGSKSFHRIKTHQYHPGEKNEKIKQANNQASDI